MIKRLIKKFTPSFALLWYHVALGQIASWYYGRPSERMVVIGVTGTNGKSTTVMLIAAILQAAGHTVGATSTVMFKVGVKEWLNDQKMTMVGRFALQKLLSRMVKVGCRYAVVETSSEGIRQFRHRAINYDTAVFTNLTPEHIESHGGFDNYKNAKQKLFAKLAQESHKKINGQRIDKTIVVNGDDSHAPDFYRFWSDRKEVYGITGSAIIPTVQATDIVYGPAGVTFSVNSTIFSLKLFGAFNIYNALSAIAVARAHGVDLATCQKALENISGIPGRMEFIERSQPFRVVVDYAPEPESLRQAYQTITDHQLIVAGGRLIHVLGSCGGGRDIARRPILGRMAGERAGVVIVTNEDPYDDDPQAIIDDVARGATEAGKIADQDLFMITDRREAITKAMSLARPGDLVLLTGKGSEQAICAANGRKVPWDERQVAREALSELGYRS